jgi:hypothetical protein
VAALASVPSKPMQSGSPNAAAPMPSKIATAAEGRKAASGGSGPAAEKKAGKRSFTRSDATGSSTGERARLSRYSAMDRNK